ncbi:hypothetical protein BGW80DRAFT_857272 [Lactifluus volemus]|nr:hypothetical protein BGW80DRAFT_857272 [Lactifluus volemus]
MTAAGYIYTLEPSFTFLSCIIKMVNWHDPTVLYQDYLALIKLGHVVAGIYMCVHPRPGTPKTMSTHNNVSWEMVVTAGFELDVLRGKRPYRRTIWLYLGTRYCALFMLIIFLIRVNSSESAKLACQFVIVNNVLVYASWLFASLLITLRVQVITGHLEFGFPHHVFSFRIAIWNWNIYMSSLLIGTWLADLALYIYLMVELRTSYDPTLETCTTSTTHSFRAGVAGSLVTDVILVISMLIGLVRSPHSSTTGLWRLLYQQCFIWLVLAMLADVPLMVLLILDLNDAMDKV